MDNKLQNVFFHKELHFEDKTTDSESHMRSYDFIIQKNSTSNFKVQSHLHIKLIVSIKLYRISS